MFIYSKATELNIHFCYIPQKFICDYLGIIITRCHKRIIRRVSFRLPLRKNFGWLFIWVILSELGFRLDFVDYTDQF
jgi:hypothetical protein